MDDTILKDQVHALKVICLNILALDKAASPRPWTAFNAGTDVSWVHCQKDNAKPERIPQRELCHMESGWPDADLTACARNFSPVAAKIILAVVEGLALWAFSGDTGMHKSCKIELQNIVKIWTTDL